MAAQQDSAKVLQVWRGSDFICHIHRNTINQSKEPKLVRQALCQRLLIPYFTLHLEKFALPFNILTSLLFEHKLGVCSICFHSNDYLIFTVCNQISENSRWINNILLLLFKIKNVFLLLCYLYPPPLISFWRAGILSQIVRRLIFF